MITAAGVGWGVQREESLHSCAWRGRERMVKENLTKLNN